MSDSTLVLGGGIAGASAAYWLARDGHDVTLVEASSHLAAHSSSRSAAIFRAAVDDPATRALALESGAWLREEAQAVLGRGVLDQVGLVVTEGERPDSPPPAWAEELVALGEAERLDADGVARRAPLLRPRGRRAWWLPQSGRVAANALVSGLVKAAGDLGASVTTGQRVAGLTVEDGRVTGACLVSGERLVADRVVVAAGAWSAGLGAAVGAPLPLTSTVRHLLVSDPVTAGVDLRAPVVWDDVAGFYARPYDGGLLLCACDEARAEPDELAPRYAVDPAVERRTLGLAGELLATPRPLAVRRAWSGLRDLTPDDRPVLGPDPRVPGLAWCAALGGHGLTIGVAAGRALADRVAGRPDGLPEDVGPERFTAGSPAPGLVSSAAQ